MDQKAPLKKMKSKRQSPSVPRVRFPSALVIFCALVLFSARAHEVPYTHFHAGTNHAAPLKLEVETSGPIPAPSPLPASVPVSGQGFWKFAAATNVLPIPEEARPHLKGAHGTIIVDAKRDIAYWGLQGVGWVAFSNRLANSWVVKRLLNATQP